MLFVLTQSYKYLFIIVLAHRQYNPQIDLSFLYNDLKEVSVLLITATKQEII